MICHIKDLPHIAALRAQVETTHAAIGEQSSTPEQCEEFKQAVRDYQKVVEEAAASYSSIIDSMAQTYASSPPA